MLKTRVLEPILGEGNTLRWNSSSLAPLECPRLFCLDSCEGSGICRGSAFTCGCGGKGSGNKCCLNREYQIGKASATSPSGTPTGLGFERFESTTKAAPLFNSCVHERKVGHTFPYLLVTESSSPGKAYISSYTRKNMVGSWNSLGTLTPVQWSAFDGAQRRAWWSMQPRYESEIQFLNFLYEMRDFKRLAKSLMKINFSKILLKLRDLRRRLVRMSNERKTLLGVGKTLADYTKTAAEARLVNEFAIKPLISDITAMLHTLALTVERAQEAFAVRGQASQISHYTESLPVETSGSFGSGNNSMFFTGVVSEVSFTATMQYAYKYKMRKGWDLLKRGMGLEFNAEVIWNAIPFSFLVDYFYEVGDAIHSMATDPNVTTALHQYCESIMQYKSSGVQFDTASSKARHFYCPTQLGLGQTNFVPVTGYTGSYYRRRVTSPNRGAALPRISSPSNGQMWNMAALLRCFFT